MNLKNRLPAKITGVKKGKLNAHVSMLWESTSLSVIITTASAEEMNLAEGDEVEALFKASDVILAKGLSGMLSARNILRGEIIEIKEGFPLAMVTLDAAGHKIAAELTLSSAKEMELKLGEQVEVVIKSSELILSKRI